MSARSKSPSGSAREAPAASDAPRENGREGAFPIVGIGASAGGLDAFKALLGALPPDTGMTYLLVQHLDPHHSSLLAEILGRSAPVPVLEAAHGLALKANHAYVIPPNVNMAVSGGRIVLTPRIEVVGPHLPIDFLFRSMAGLEDRRAIGVVLSGTGSDGTLGLCEIKATGGITFAQEEQTAGQPGMPRSALDSGCVDFVLSPEEIAARLGEMGTHPYLSDAARAGGAGAASDQAEFREIVGLVRSRKQVDFTLYRDTTVRRRIMRRMALHRHATLGEYARRLQSDGEEVDALYHDLLINVTSFFRDPPLFEALKATVYPAIAAGKAPNEPLRVWVAGCSTGQEAYSIAMTLVEFFDDKPARPPIQIFATDLADQTALSKARSGVYPESIEAEISPERLRRFFQREDHVWQVSKALRDMCIFARHNMTSDPPFSHLDLISCRNVLIYLAPALQKRVLPTFHYALDVPGFLVLGSAETVGEGAELFDLADRGNRIYTKKARTARLPAHFPGESLRSSAAYRPAGGAERPEAGPAEFQREADRILLGRYSPPGVLVDEGFEVLQFRGQTGPYLEAPPGEPTTNLLKLAREGLLVELKNALAQVRETSRPVRRERVRLRASGGPREVTLEVLPVRPYGGGDGCALVLFHHPDSEGAATTLPPLPPEAVEAGADGDSLALRQELVAMREYLQSLSEQQDAANEELRSANEEILSSNEELQSTNEELETAKEELQSANEELTTINEQLQQRNVELNQVNGDLVNLQSSTTIPVIMVGGDLRIRRFTAPARRALHLLPTDIGRPLRDLDLLLHVPDLVGVIQTVIETVQPTEREVRDLEGHWYAVRIHPYRTLDNRIDGAVLVFVDIDASKRSEGALRDADRKKDVFLATLAHELRNPIAPIRNAIEILRLAEGDAAAAVSARDVLHRQVGQLSRIVDDLIDLGRIVEGKIELRIRPVELGPIVELAVETTRTMMESFGHRLRVSISDRPLRVDVDPGRMTQVLVNLLTNAAKFTRPGGQIALTVEPVPARRRSDPENEEIRIVVKDSGMGIAPDLLPRVFDMFVQGERVYENSRGGLGIGLSLVKSLVERHGGRVEVASDGIDQGSEFRVFLRLALAEPAVLPPEPVPAPGEDPVTRPHRRILVVDDNPDQTESLSMLLVLMGHEVFVAENGKAAIETALEKRPDLALVDIGLPGMSGYDVARRLRAEASLEGLVLVAQTGWGQDEDRRRSAQAGFDHHVVKPVEIDALRRILALPVARAADPA